MDGWQQHLKWISRQSRAVNPALNISTQVFCLTAPSCKFESHAGELWVNMQSHFSASSSKVFAWFLECSRFQDFSTTILLSASSLAAALAQTALLITMIGFSHTIALHTSSWQCHSFSFRTWEQILLCTILMIRATYPMWLILNVYLYLKSSTHLIKMHCMLQHFPMSHCMQTFKN